MNRLCGGLLVAVGACSFRAGAFQDVDDATPMADVVVPDVPEAGCRATSIAANGGHTCVTLNDRSVRCWGYNTRGQVGLAPGASSSCTNGGPSFPCVPTPHDPGVPGFVTVLGLGDVHSCAVSDGQAYCWGANTQGQFGDNNSGDTPTPRLVAARAGAFAIAGGETHTCSLHAGAIKCSGLNGESEIGDGTTLARPTPVSPLVLTSASALGAYFHNTCVVSGGAVYCWGDNAFNQVDGTFMDPKPVPTQVNAIATQVAVGATHACALLANSTVGCWGGNGASQVGRGTVSVSEPPGVVTGVDNATQVVSGAYHSCARISGGSVRCWGEGFPMAGVTIALSRPALYIAAGAYHSCAIVDDGHVWCWGRNVYGEYGNGTPSGGGLTPTQSLICQ